MAGRSLGFGTRHVLARPILRWLARGGVVLLLVGLGVLLDSRSALAATRFVTSTADSGPGTLRDSIAAAAPGDTIQFAFPNGTAGCSGGACTITLTSGDLRIERDLTILGPGASLLTVARSSAPGTPRFRIVTVRPSAHVKIDRLTLTNGDVDDGQVTAYFFEDDAGGGILNQGSLALSNAAIIGNSAKWGGGICNDAGILVITRSRVSGNQAVVGGGFLARGSTTLTDSTVASNRAGSGGGIVSVAPVTVANSAVTGNVAENNVGGGTGGGIVVNSGGALTLVNSTVSENSAGIRGGGLHVDSSQSTNVIHATITQNNSPIGGAIFVRSDLSNTAGILSVKNSIVQRDPSFPAIAACDGPITLLGNNLSDDASCGMPIGDLRLGPLQDNGGLTFTHSLGAGSAAIGGGASGGCTDGMGRGLLTDQRGMQRPLTGNCDLGAYQTLPATAGFPPVPVISDVFDRQTREDTAFGPIELMVAARDKAATDATLTVVGRSDNPAVIPDANIVLSPATSPGGPMRLTVSPVADQWELARITLTVYDNGVERVSTSFALTVLPVNDAPSFVIPAAVTVLEGSSAFSQEAWATDISAGPANESGETLAFLVEASNPSLFSAQPSISRTGTLSFTPAPNAAGSTTVFVTLKDDAGTQNGGADTSPQRSFTVTLTPVNSRPTFVPGGNVAIAPKDGAYNQSWASSVAPGPVDESNQSVAFHVSTDNPALFLVQPTLSSTGVLSFVPAANGDGTATITVVLKDDGGTVNGGLDTSGTVTFTIVVSPKVNKPPTATGDGFAVGYNTPLQVAAPGVLGNDTDPEGEPLTAVRVKDPAHGSLTLNGDGSFTYAPAAGYSGPDSFTYKANDGNADSEVVAVSLTVATPVSGPGATPSPTPGTTPGTTPGATPSPTTGTAPGATPSPTPAAVPGATPGPTLVLPLVPCSPRPNPSMRSEQIGPGRLRVTLAAQTNAGLTSNALARVLFGTATNARVELPGAAPGANGGPATVPGQPDGTPGGFSLTLAAQTQTTSFIVQRQAPGPFQVEITIFDGCGDSKPFKTLVGGGAAVQ